MIVAAAIRYKGVIFTGVRHSEIMGYIQRLPFNWDKTLAEQGFVDHRNKYHNRAESKIIVLDCGQEYSKISLTLTSEELW